MNYPHFTVYTRNKIGTYHTQILYKTNKVSGIIYNKDYNKPIYLDSKDVQTMSKFFIEGTQIFSISLETQKFLTIVKDIKIHPIKSDIIHIDLQKVELDSLVKTKVLFNFIEEKKSPGILAGGYLIKHMSKITVKTLVKNLPKFIDVDLSKLNIGQALLLKNIIFPDNYEIPLLHKKENLNLIIASIVGSRVLTTTTTTTETKKK